MYANSDSVYMVNNTICETGNVLINGANVVTINSESTEIEDIKKTIADLGLEDVENINYLQAIKRVIGMIPQPLANWGWGPEPGYRTRRSG